MVRALTQPIRTVVDRCLFHVGRRIRSRHVLAAIRRHAPPAGRVLDAGCGGGGFALAIARRYPHLEVEGIELEPEKVVEGEGVARRLGLRNVRFATGDVTRCTHSAGYDLVLSIDVLEHVPDDGAALSAFAGELKPGGLLVLHTPRSSPRRFLPALEHHHQDDHVRDGYEPEALAGRLRDAGFVEVAVHRTFGATGELAWEIMQLLRRGNPSRGRELVGVVLSPLLLLLCELDFWFGGGEHGNGLLVLARRAAAQPEGRGISSRAVATAAHGQ